MLNAISLGVVMIVAPPRFSNIFRTQEGDELHLHKSHPIDDVRPAKMWSATVVGTRPRTRRSWDASAEQDLPQNDRIVMSSIMRCKDECNPSSLGERAQFAEPIAVLT